MAYENTLYKELASKIQGRLSCIESGNKEWEVKHTDAIEQIAKDCLPSGSGFDSGTHVDLEKSTGEYIILHFSYHHMDQNGMYDGWSNHQAEITPSLCFGYNLYISEDKDYREEKEKEWNDIVNEYGEDSPELEECYSHDHDFFIEYASETLDYYLNSKIVWDEKTQGYRRLSWTRKLV